MKILIAFAILGAVREFAKGFSSRGQAIIYGLYLWGIVLVGKLVWQQTGLAWLTPITAAVGITALNIIPIIRRYAKEIEIYGIISLLIAALLVSPKKSAGLTKATAAPSATATATTTVGKYTAMSDIVMYANQFVGCPYVWGGNSLKNGCDCSHFVYNILRDLGYYEGGYVTSTFWAEKGEPVEGGLANAQAGDIIVYAKNSKGIGHVAIYDGEGHIIEAQGSSKGITNDRPVETGREIIGVRRFTKTNKPSESQACLLFITYVTILC